MSDRHTASSPRPHADWDQAFAALPQETPDPGSWQRIAASAWPRRRARWPAWLATAAMLGLAALLPWRDVLGPASQNAPQVAPDNALDNQPDAGASRPAGPGVTASTGNGAATATGAREPTPASPQSRAVAERAPVVAAASDARPPTVPAAELERLYAESAQLEALVALARETRVVTTGPAAALASRFETRVAEIDARLVALGTTGASPERARLWRERVAAMRDLASFETTQRLLASRGERYDAMLVSID